jgi:hypothetical protein
VATLKVVAVGTSGADLPETVRGLTGNFATSRFDVELGTRYAVYSICMWSGGTLHYLLDPFGDSRPSWYPADLFNIEDASMPTVWRFGYRGVAPEGAPASVSAIWGYPEMVEESSHYFLLQDRDCRALDVFRDRKREMDLRLGPEAGVGP